MTLSDFSSDTWNRQSWNMWPASIMPNVTNGRMISKVIGNTEINGKTYSVIETTYENIFGVPPQRGYLRLPIRKFCGQE